MLCFLKDGPSTASFSYFFFLWKLYRVAFESHTIMTKDVNKYNDRFIGIGQLRYKEWFYVSVSNTVHKIMYDSLKLTSRNLSQTG